MPNWHHGDEDSLPPDLRGRPTTPSTEPNLTDTEAQLGFTAMLGTPFPQDVDPRRLSTGNDALDWALIRWLDRREYARTVRREGERCVLVDRGQEIREQTSAGYEDSVRKCLQIAIDADYFEAKTGRKPGPND